MFSAILTVSNPFTWNIYDALGGGAQPHATEPFTKAVIRVVPAMVSSLHVAAGLQQLPSFPQKVS